MSSTRKILLMSSSLLLVAACSTDLQRLQSNRAQSGQEFTNVLSQEYRSYAELQSYNGDFMGSEHAARKGTRAARGEQFPPEEIGARYTPQASVAGDIKAARDRLTSALSAGATTKAPAAAARAQARFDCWIENADDPFFATDNEWRRQHVQICRNEFQSAMAEVDAAMRPPQTAAAPPPPPPPAMPPAQRSFVVFFDFDKAELSPEAERVVADIVRNQRQLSSARVSVTGYADRAGADAYNQGLSVQRANSVRDALTRNGVPADRIAATGRGESQPRIATDDGAREPQNRRAEVTLE